MSTTASAGQAPETNKNGNLYWDISTAATATVPYFNTYSHTTMSSAWVASTSTVPSAWIYNNGGKWANGEAPAGYGSFVPLDKYNRPIACTPNHPQPVAGWFEGAEKNPCGEIAITQPEPAIYEPHNANDAGYANDVGYEPPVNEEWQGEEAPPAHAHDVVELRHIISKRYDIVKKKIVNEVCIIEEEEESPPVSGD